MDEDATVKEAEEYNAAGNCAFKDKEYEKAIRFYTYSIGLCPKEARYYSNRSAAYLGSGDRSRALADAEKTVDLSPTWAKGYSREASVYLRLKKYKDCIEACKIALSLEPSNEAVIHILEVVDKITSANKAEDFSALEAAEAMSDNDQSTEEGLSRLKAIRENKKLEEFLATVNKDFKPVVDTQKSRSVSDDGIINMTAIQHVERLSGKNAFWKNLNPYRVLMLPVTASDEDIRQRYLKFSAMLHPDKCSHPGARESYEAVVAAYAKLKDPKVKDECVKLIKGATKTVVKNHQRLIDKGMDPSVLPKEEDAIEEEVMRVFAQNEQRQRQQKQYFHLNERRDKERLEEKRQKTLKEIKDHREWMNGMDERVSSWRKHQEKMRKRKPDIDMDALSGETDADKRRRQSERDAAVALGEEYKLMIAAGIAAVTFFVYRKYHGRTEDNSSTVWVIGASSGIGKAVAIQYALQGKQVILSSRSSSTLAQVQTDIVEKTGKDKASFPILTVDIEQDELFHDKVTQALGFFGSVDIVVISSGLGIRAFNDETTKEVEKRMMQTNYMGPILLAKAVLPSMRARHSGTLVFISSVQGFLSVPARSSYSAAKHALQGYCESIRAEEKANGVNVLVVSPAYVRTTHSLHSIRGDGSSYNRMDETTKKGMEPEVLAKMIYKSVLKRDGILIVAPLYMRLVIVLQYLLPGLVATFMNHKAQKARSNVQ